MNRQQYVSVSDVQSSIKGINIGVPQGSVLGPLLFLTYINDMKTCLEHLKYIHFADDTAVVLEGSDMTEMCTTVNCELDRLHTWLCTNRLSLNKSKTSFMIFSNIHRFPATDIMIGGSKISQSDSARYLGIIIDCGLNFKLHFDYVIQKISACYGVLRRLSLYTPKYILRTIYLSLIYPYLMY